MSRKFCLSRHDSHLCSGDCPDLRKLCSGACVRNCQPRDHERHTRQPASDAAGRTGRHVPDDVLCRARDRRDRMEAASLLCRQKNPLVLHLPALYDHLHSGLHHRALFKRVEVPPFIPPPPKRWTRSVLADCAKKEAILCKCCANSAISRTFVCLLLLLLSGCLAKTVFQYAPFQDETAFCSAGGAKFQAALYHYRLGSPRLPALPWLLTVNGEFFLRNPPF